MSSYAKSLKVEGILFVRNFFGFFFTFFFPAIMLILFGSIYGNEASEFFGGLGSMDVAVPSYIAMIIGVNGLMSFPLALAEYKEKGIYKRFDATPAGKEVIIKVQVMINFVMTVLGILLLVILGKLIYNVQISGNIFAIIGAVLLSIAAIFSLGFFITAIARDAKITNLLCYLLYFIMLFASGATLPSELFPQGIRTVSKILPLTHAADLMKGVFAGKPFGDFSVAVVLLAAFTLIFSGFGALIYHKKRWS